MDAFTRSALHAVLAAVGLFLAWATARTAAAQGQNLWWQIGLGAAAYMGAIALAGMLFNLAPADAVHDATHVLVVITLTTLDVVCAVILALCGLRALFTNPDHPGDAPAGLPDADTYAKTA